MGPPCRDPPLPGVRSAQGQSLSGRLFMPLPRPSASLRRPIRGLRAPVLHLVGPSGLGRVPQGCPGKGRGGTGTQRPRKRQPPRLLPLLILQL